MAEKSCKFEWLSESANIPEYVYWQCKSCKEIFEDKFTNCDVREDFTIYPSYNYCSNCGCKIEKE